MVVSGFRTEIKTKSYLIFGSMNSLHRKLSERFENSENVGEKLLDSFSDARLRSLSGTALCSEPSIKTHGQFKRGVYV